MKLLEKIIQKDDEGKDWALYYKTLGVYAFPPKWDGHPYENTDTKIGRWWTFRKLNWTYDSRIYGNASKLGIKVIEIDVSWMNEKDIYYIVCFTNNMLHLNRNPWIIIYREKHYIPVKTITKLYVLVKTDYIEGKSPERKNDVNLFWEGNFPLPVGGYNIQFYYNAIPTVPPPKVDNKDLEQCIESLIFRISTEKREAKGRDKEESHFSQYNPANQLGKLCKQAYDRREAKRLGISMEDYKIYDKQRQKYLDKIKKKALKKERKKYKKMALRYNIWLIISIAIDLLIMAILLLVIAGA